MCISRCIRRAGGLRSWLSRRHVSKWPTPMRSRSWAGYVIVREMVHLIEPTHNERFLAILWASLTLRGARPARNSMNCRSQPSPGTNSKQQRSSPLIDQSYRLVLRFMLPRFTDATERIEMAHAHKNIKTAPPLSR